MTLDAFRVGVMGASDVLQVLRDGGCYLNIDEEARLLDALETEESARCGPSKTCRCRLEKQHRIRPMARRRREFKFTEPAFHIPCFWQSLVEQRVLRLLHSCQERHRRRGFLSRAALVLLEAGGAVE